MVIGIIGESCTGKSTIVKALEEKIDITTYSGKDYLKLAGNETIAKNKFEKLLADSGENTIVYIITEKEHLDLLPADAYRVLVTEKIETIKARFRKRMHGNLPKPVEMMLEKKHHMFDDGDYDLHLDACSLDESVHKILKMIDQ